ncbi:DNA (cytosine-5-)-methyltransferase [Psychrobacter sp. JCM 18902]|uniref:DNA (cytosine-5-)-methyltransferase n=1 Tax=Psychrobacter sp. JCM 18902 TaxID=1298607 RepID=UPI00191AA735|nr:DNA (cytosine-5-)-methyltransferase [Psychrobacter sp. JCM 18902]
MSQDIRVVELFAGVGGFRLGLESASTRFKTVWANQWEPNKKTQHAFDCYVEHFGSDNHVNADIATVKHIVPDHDLLVGGFPCQDYSVASTGAKGIEGTKGVLWWEIRDIIESKKPKWVLLENVDRLLKSPSSQRGRDFAVILRCLIDLGYCVEWRVINAADYGYAQRRRRVFIFASQQSCASIVDYSKTDPSDLVIKEGFFAQTFPVEDAVNTKKTSNLDISKDKFKDLKALSDSFAGQFYNAGVVQADGSIFSTEILPIKVDPVPLKDILEEEAVDEKFFLKQNLEKWEYLKGAKKIPRIKPNGEPYFYAEGGMSFPDNIDVPARTILTSESSVNRSSHVVVDKTSGKLRLLTPIECERLNGFPDNWTDTGMPHKFRYFAMGNALVVPIVERIGKQLINV